MKELNNRTLWTFELRTQEGTIVPIWIFVRFHLRVIFDSQTVDSDTFKNL